jgi:glutamate synthase domain-containing protein 1
MNTTCVTSEDKTPIRTEKGVGWSKGRNVTVEKTILNRILYKMEDVTHEQASVVGWQEVVPEKREELSEMAKEAPTMEKPLIRSLDTSRYANNVRRPL